MKAAVIGSGAWGTALALLLLKNGHEVCLWTHDPDKAKYMEQTGQNPRLTGVQLPRQLQITDKDACVADCELVVFACPSVHMRQVCARLAGHIADTAVIASATKGIEHESLLRMSQIIRQLTGKNVVVLTGPSHAEEAARDIPTALLAACSDKTLAEFVQDAFVSDTLRVYTSPDTVGAELGGAVKNVIALCAGVIEGMGYGDNTVAMLATRGLTELARLGVAMGAEKETFAGLAGVGDLLVTCTSGHSRNRAAGVLIGQGVPVQEAMRRVGAVVEGYYAAGSVKKLAESRNVDMPIVAAACAVLYDGVPAQQVVPALLCRQRRCESEDAGWL